MKGSSWEVLHVAAFAGKHRTVCALCISFLGEPLGTPPYIEINLQAHFYLC